MDVWKYSIQGYESDDEIESNIYYTVLNAAVSEWMDAAGDFPVDEDWNYLPEFLEFILSLVKRYRIIRTVWKNRISMSM